MSITLNLFEVILNKTSLTIVKTPYSKIEFDECKSKYPDYFFYRFDNFIYAWQRSSTAQFLPEQFVDAPININEHSPILTKIIEVSITEVFKRRDYKTYYNKYSSTWEITLKQESNENFGSLSLIPTLLLSVRNLYSKQSQKQIIALTVRKQYKSWFTSSEEKIKEQRIDTRDWTRSERGDIVASAKNKREYLEASGLNSRFKQFLNKVESTEYEFKYVQETLNRFNEIRQRIYLPNGFKITNFLLVNLPNSLFELSYINKPSYYFYNERTKNGFYYDQVLAELKPYSYDNFSARELKVLTFTPKEYEGSVGTYVTKLQKKLFDIFHVSTKFISRTFEGSNGYLNILKTLDLNSYDVAVVIVSERDKALSIQMSPYYIIKAKFLNQRLPTQDLTIEVIRRSNDFIEKNIALNIYSKIGGTAWTIEKTERNVSELIIGIGSTTDQNNNAIIGFANIFDYNGTYLLGDCSQISTKENYVENLGEYLVNNLEQAFEQKGFSINDEIRLIFHLYKEASKDYELKAIDKVLTHFNKYRIQFGIIHLSYSHNYRVFNDQGSTQVKRGTFIQLASYQALLHLGGYSKVPILIRLDKRSTYKDIYDATKQVLYFSHLSHRTFIPPSIPITIKYPSIMAKLVHELNQVSGWDVDILNQLNDRLWFI